MATYNKIYGFVEHLAEKVHDLGADSFGVALTTHANIPTVGMTATLASLTVIAYTNLSTRVVGTATSSAQTSGTYKLVLPDLVLTASGTVATFRHTCLYNDTPTLPADPLIAWWDYGSDVVLLSGETFTVDFDASNGVLTIA